MTAPPKPAGTAQLHLELADKRRQVGELESRRRRIVHRSPGEVDHLGQPMDPKGEVAQIDKQIASFGDLADLEARATHASRLADRAMHDVRGHAAAFFAEILGELRPEGVARVEAVQAALAQLHDGLDHYMDYCKKLQLLKAAVENRKRDGVDTAVDAAQGIRRALRDVGVPLPETSWPRAEICPACRPPEALPGG